MNILPFPVRPAEEAQARSDWLPGLIAALRALGEPATTPELLDLLTRLAVVDAETEEPALAAYLERHSWLRSAGGEHIPVFRSVWLNGGPAWAFTPTFRAALHARGMPPALRRRP